MLFDNYKATLAYQHVTEGRNDRKFGNEWLRERVETVDAISLNLNCDKALSHLKWQANLEYKDTIKFTSEWYYDYYKSDKNMFDKTVEQISEYEDMANNKCLEWTA